MAYVGEPFAHDIFVSYSHGDVDGTGASKLHQWSTAFVRELESELKQFPHLAGELQVFLATLTRADVPVRRTVSGC